MQLRNIDIVGNRIKTAKHKLSKHNNLGEKSNLSIFEVAQLMDMIKNGEGMEGHSSNSIYFSLN